MASIDEARVQAHRDAAPNVFSIDELEERYAFYLDRFTWVSGDPSDLAIAEVYEEEISHRKRGRSDTFQQVLLPIIRRVLPNVIAKELVGVQPMPGPTGEIFKLRHTYGNSSNKNDA